MRKKREKTGNIIPCFEEVAVKKTAGYKEAIEEIEAIVNEIEQEAVDVDMLTEKVKRAAYLIRLCREKLKATDRDVKGILRGLENTVEKES